MWLTSSFGLLMATPFISYIVQVDGLTCLHCKDVTSPDQCQEKTICGQEEVCFTEEYTDNMGMQLFRLGCAGEARCRRFFNAQTLPHADNSATCFQCCSDVECNGGLCQTVAGRHFVAQNISTTSSMGVISQQDVSCNTSNGCDDKYVAFKDYCYLVTPGQSPWHDAVEYCRTLGGELLSITSQEEFDFLAEELSAYNKFGYYAMWIGDYFSPEKNQWQWLDGSPFTFTKWTPSYPIASDSFTGGLYYYVKMLNIDYGGTWINDKGDISLAAVCKKHRQL